jgi:siroheme synthase
VASASRPDEQVIETTLGDLPGLQKLPAPAILLIGTVRAKATSVGPTPKNTGKSGTDH